MKRKVKHLYAWIIMVLFIICVYFPIYWLLAMSFKQQVDIVSTPPKWFFKPTLSNYTWLRDHTDVGGGLKRSLIVAFSSTALAALIGLPAGYALARFNFRRKDDVDMMKMIRSYKGVRHEEGQKVRGQRTRSNGRTGLTLGVMRQRLMQPGAAPAAGGAPAPAAAEKKEEKPAAGAKPAAAAPAAKPAAAPAAKK